MKLFAQVLIIAICAYAASGLSFGSIINATENAADNLINKIENILHPYKPTVSTADTCYSSYNTQLSSVNNETVRQTKSCYAAAESNVASFAENINSSLVEVKNLSEVLQSQLAACEAETTSSDAFNCYVSTFDENLKNLDDLTITSQLAVAYLAGYQSEVEITKSGCVSSVILQSKANSTIALNTLESCLDNVSSSSSASTGSSSNSSSSSSSASNSSSSSSSSSSSANSSSSSATGTGSQIEVQIF